MQTEPDTPRGSLAGFLVGLMFTLGGAACAYFALVMASAMVVGLHIILLLAIATIAVGLLIPGITLIVINAYRWGKHR